MSDGAQQLDDGDNEFVKLYWLQSADSAGVLCCICISPYIYIPKSI